MQYNVHSIQQKACRYRPQYSTSNKNRALDTRFTCVTIFHESDAFELSETLPTR